MPSYEIRLSTQTAEPFNCSFPFSSGHFQNRQKAAGEVETVGGFVGFLFYHREHLLTQLGASKHALHMQAGSCCTSHSNKTLFTLVTSWHFPALCVRVHFYRLT